VDKTGTLTLNRMAVSRTWVPDPQSTAGIPEDARVLELLEFSLLASEREPFDPMEKAYYEHAQERAPEAIDKVRAWTLSRSYPLSPGQISVAHIWLPLDSDRYLVAAKGAPEAIADLCGLVGAKRFAVLEQASAMAGEGLRVLAVAKGSLAPTHPTADHWPASQGELQLQLVGLTGLADPMRPAVPIALKECYAAGIRTVMITGDYPGTAQAIARQIGLANPETVVTGSELEAMSDVRLRERVAVANIFARVVPQQKLRLIEALEANGEIVAMTGDGVNDAPALKAAHIGVAMGKRGSDVAREAASLVLLEDDFASLVDAVRLGRRIFDNIQKAMCYIVAVHIPTAGMALLPLFFGWPLLFYPLHIVFLEFVIDPACSIAFEAEPPDGDVMRRPPRPATSRLFGRRMLATSIAQGTSVLVAVAVLYALTLSAGTSEAQARAMAFTAVVLGNVGLILANRSPHETLLATLRRPNPALGWIVGATLVALGFALYAQPMRELFRFGPLAGSQLLVAVTAAALGLAFPEIYKWLRPSATQLRAA
jgi:Ca2+-transporting ATPase